MNFVEIKYEIEFSTTTMDFYAPCPLQSLIELNVILYGLFLSTEMVVKYVFITLNKKFIISNLSA
jgi:hypothetical protein